MANDMSIVYGILLFFFTIGAVASFINAEYNAGIPEYDGSAISDDLQQADLESSTQAFNLIADIGKMFYWTYGLIPRWVDIILFIPLRIVFWFLLARNIWPGGGA